MANKAISNESLGISSGKKAFRGKKTRIGIIGCGGICQTHMKAYQEIPEAEIVACCDILPERLENMKEKWGISKGY
ncbi:MAG: Gfo/Idh/MocA family oxidoreductase, partial [Lentisphaeria bacterium]|nr:Gfo/Idh/MocA family oxidoreductase [Lentisphaeria bacterium]